MNARIIDWICCPDCGCNVLKAQAIDKMGNPVGLIECPTCLFVANADTVKAMQEWALLCQSIGHTWIEVRTFPDGDSLRRCAWCGKHEVSK